MKRRVASVLGTTYIFRLFGPGLPFVLGAPLASGVGADLFSPGLGPGTPFRFASAFEEPSSSGGLEAVGVSLDSVASSCFVSGSGGFSSGRGLAAEAACFAREAFRFGWAGENFARAEEGRLRTIRLLGLLDLEAPLELFAEGDVAAVF